MAISLAVLDTGRRGNKRYIKYKALFTGNYVTGGDVCDLTQASNLTFMTLALPSPSYIIQPQDVSFQDAVAGNDPEWITGTTNANGKVQIFSSGGAELAAAAYSAAILADELFFTVEIPIGK